MELIVNQYKVGYYQRSPYNSKDEQFYCGSQLITREQFEQIKEILMGIEAFILDRQIRLKDLQIHLNKGAQVLIPKYDFKIYFVGPCVVSVIDKKPYVYGVKQFSLELLLLKLIGFEFHQTPIFQLKTSDKIRNIIYPDLHQANGYEPAYFVTFPDKSFRTFKRYEVGQQTAYGIVKQVKSTKLEHNFQLYLDKHLIATVNSNEALIHMGIADHQLTTKVNIGTMINIIKQLKGSL